MVRSGWFVRLLFLSCALALGCAKSSPGPTAGSTSSSSGANPVTMSSSASGSSSQGAFWEDYPDAPKLDLMTEVDGIKIPRMPKSSETLQMSGAIPVDEFNTHARQKPGEPVTGDTLTIRFNAEPKVLNPITENSAVMRYIMQYVSEYLYKQNFETFVWEPRLAKNSIVEDSVILSADYPGRERRISLKDEPAVTTLEFDYVVPPPVDQKPAEGPILKFKTFDKAGKSVGNTWVGIYPIGKIPGASVYGYHQWSNDQGELEVSKFPPGRYTVKTGDEIYGATKKGEEGSLLVSPRSSENPLREPLTLKNGEWQDIQAQTLTTFYLREDAKWSDGTPFTTKDLEFTYALMHNDDVDGDSIRTYYADLVECRAFGPHVIRMKYRQQYFLASEFLYQLGYHAPPFHFFEAIFKEQGRELTLDRLTPDEEAAKKRISAHGQEFGKFFNTDERYNSKPLGNGPYIVDKWERKDRVELVRNPNYWEPKKAGHVDRIIVKFIPDQVTAFKSLKAGEIDFLYDMSPDQYFEDWSSLGKEAQDTYVKANWFSPNYLWIGWNQLAEPLKDRRVRLALAMLFDRKDFIEKKLHDQAVPVSGHQYIFGPAYDHEVLPIGYDPSVARELLTDAGWSDTDNDGILDRNGVKFQILLRMGKGKPISEQMCEVIQKNCKSVGIDFQFQAMEWASFVDKLRSKESDAVMLRWTMDPEGDPYQIWHSSEAAREKRGSNVVSFKSQLADDLIEMIRVTLDPGKRARLQQSFHRLLDYEQPYAFMWTPKELGAYHKRFRNVKWYRLRPGFDLAEWYVPKDEQLHK